jgi:hypothetical protein
VTYLIEGFDVPLRVLEELVNVLAKHLLKVLILTLCRVGRLSATQILAWVDIGGAVFFSVLKNVILRPTLMWILVKALWAFSLVLRTFLAWAHLLNLLWARRRLDKLIELGADLMLLSLRDSELLAASKAIFLVLDPWSSDRTHRLTTVSIGHWLFAIGRLQKFDRCVLDRLFLWPLLNPSLWRIISILSILFLAQHCHLLLVSFI